MEHAAVEKRQNYNEYYYDDGYGGNSWWYSSTGYAVRYAIVGGLFVLFLAFFLGGYIHARRRLKKGLQPLAYHRWMVRRQMYYAAGYPQARAWPQHGTPQYRNDAHANFMPPPAYNAEYAPPPTYPDGQDGSKIAADQRYGGATNRAGESSSSSGLVYPAAPAPAAGVQTRV